MPEDVFSGIVVGVLIACTVKEPPRRNGDIAEVFRVILKPQFLQTFPFNLDEPISMPSCLIIVALVVF